MFQLYLRLGSAAEVARRINELGWERETTRTRAGREVGGGVWTEKDFHMLLCNPICLGKVDFEGEHGQPSTAGGAGRAHGDSGGLRSKAHIVDAPLFEQVQRTLDAKACGRGPRRGRNPEYQLHSLLHCGLCGLPMTTTAGKGRSGEVYRYYACRNRARKTEDRCEHPRLSAPEVEELVISRVRHVCADQAMRAHIAERMRVSEPGMAARMQEQRAEAEATRLALRAEAEKLMRSLGHEASGRASHLLAERIGAIEAELEPVHARIAQLDAQMQALQRAAEQGNRGRLPAAADRRAAVAVRSTDQTIRILEVFDEACRIRLANPYCRPARGLRPCSVAPSTPPSVRSWC